jgi:hypothetical protein
MSLRLPQPVPPVPDDTARLARAAFPRGNPYVLLRNRLGPVFDDAGFADLYPRRGQPAYTPWRLALVTLMQFREGLSDRQAVRPSGPGSTGSTCSPLTWPMPALTTRCFASSAAGCWTGMPVSGYSPACWTRREKLDCSRCAGVSARTARTCSPRCAT